MIFAKVKEKWINGKRLESIENCETTKEGFAKFIEKTEDFTVCKSVDGKYEGSSFVFIKFEDTLDIKTILADTFITTQAFSIVDFGMPNENHIAVIFAFKTPIAELCRHLRILATLKELYPQAEISFPLSNLCFYGLPTIYHCKNLLCKKMVRLLSGDFECEK